ncbi:MAG TPA: DUF4160 domain-containing protein [Armatimonadota bacterium]|nr:DUF4160 domain-containing protein [Armatimonadota bacterium]
MYYREHQPPHFHALYGEDEALVAIDSLAILSGRLPGRALGLVIEWATLHQDELRQAWRDAEAQQPIRQIAPLA